MQCPEYVLRPDFDLHHALAQAASRGYDFADNVLTAEACDALLEEVDGLPMETGDHISRPINLDKPNQVQQMHERAYVEYGSEQTPVGNFVADAIAKAVQQEGLMQFSQLRDWHPTELGYQRYRSGADHISPHRDRASDKLLAVTLTMAGSALIKIFKPLGEPNDYVHLEQIDEYRTNRGSIMLLRAPGFANGEQVIHQVLPPYQGIRTILNLRMRNGILKTPALMK